MQASNKAYKEAKLFLAKTPQLARMLIMPEVCPKIFLNSSEEAKEWNVKTEFHPTSLYYNFQDKVRDFLYGDLTNGKTTRPCLYNISGLYLTESSFTLSQ